MDMDSLTIDQLMVFTAAVDQGSFSGAARALNRAQSAITYSIQKLEDQIGTPLFDRNDYRPTLTTPGKALLPRARRILADVNEFRGQAKAMVRGLEAEVRLGLSELVPIAQLAPHLKAFRARFPTVALRIVRQSFGMSEMLIEGTLDIGLLVDLELPSVLDRTHHSAINLIAVAAPDHALARAVGSITSDMLREELQIVLTDPRQGSTSPDYGIAALDSWRVTDLATKHTLLREGLGWGSMPEPLVSADIAAGRLVVLPVERWDGSDHLPRFDIVAAHYRQRPPGPAGTELLAALGQGVLQPT
ncbi:LysR family transcriptional regulator [Agrobacterium rhizogenes]|nr:LysR family transcriptional regulator [Rhizobium rhizogenes]NTF52790.1 LysR family transcriptional regulator [Rhizobium rhizogenes]NTF59492.1 LysR family transcriptional regulator [Rhizobium rhizogenes]NTF65820.1 LysR family transcriptional regulator [Rhizobium rhizogenes]NTF79052.1 LysR family transcriptional regulator [Rhizobium rhizogenes]NTG04709.1 LysR family transcriptional regulator [Rhizobium rhizogenes]